MRYATLVAQDGSGAVAGLVDEYNRDRKHWLSPPPVRIGYIFLVAEVMKLSGASAEKAGVSVSFAFSLLGFLIAALLGLRFLDRWTVLIGLAFLSVNPLELAIARRVWQDSAIASIGLLLFYLCLEDSVSARPSWWRVGFWVTAFYFLAVKELALFTYGFFVLWLLVNVWLERRSWRAVVAVSIPCAMAVVASYGTVVWMSGGLPPVLQIYQHLHESIPSNDYRFLSRGPWYSFVLGIWVLSPVTTLLCGLGIGRIVLSSTRFRDGLDVTLRERQAVWAMALFIPIILATASLPQDFKNLRYVSVVAAPICLMAGFLISHVLTAVRDRLAPAGFYAVVCALPVAVVLVCSKDYAEFKRIFVHYKLDDPTTIRVVNYALAAGSDWDSAPPERFIFENSPELKLSRSLALYKQGLYANAIEISREAIQLRPGYAEAWNNICASYNQLGQFDQAVAACEQALRYKPDFELANRAKQPARRPPERSGT